MSAFDRGAVRHVVLDLDGTLYKGDALLPNSLAFLELMERLAIGVTFVTNNTSRAADDYVRKLAGMGIAATAADIVTPTGAVLSELRARGAATVFVLGTAALVAEFEGGGVRSVRDERPDAVVVGFDTELTYDKLCRAAWWIDRGVPFLATHPDRICPTNLETVLPDCGALCAALTAATGRAPDRVFGKPDPSMLATVRERTGVPEPAMAVVGDRLYTDVVLGNRSGAQSVLVLTGEAAREDLEGLPSEHQPTLICDDVLEFGRALMA